MNLGSFFCRHNRHQWAFNGRIITAEQYFKGNFETFCLRCGKTKEKAS